MTRSPALVIITVAKDNPDDLLATISSVRRQSQQPSRHIVVDSSKNRHQMARISSEGGAEYIWTPAEGVFSAMSKGLAQLNGQEYCWFLNSGDLLFGDKAIFHVRERLAIKNETPDWIVGGTHLILPSGRFEKYSVNANFSHKELLSGAVWFPHPSTVYKTQSFRSSGALKGKLTIAEDYAASLRMLKTWGKPIFLREVISEHFLNGISTTKPLLRAFEASKARISVFGFEQIISELIQLSKVAIRALLYRFLSSSPAE